MNSKSRIKKLLNFKETDRVGIGDEFWTETLERWHIEGLPKDIPIYDYFGFDYWFKLYDCVPQDKEPKETVYTIVIPKSLSLDGLNLESGDIGLILP